MSDPYLEFEFNEIESGLRLFQDFRDGSIHRDLQRFWNEQLEITKRALLEAETHEEVLKLQGMGQAQQQGLLLTEAFIRFLEKDA